jgi:hypothetical protein
LIAVAEKDPAIGLVNPASSTFGNHPGSGVSLDAHAQKLAPLRGTYTEVGMCIGFCVLIKRKVLDKLEGLTEEVERIFFEDEDFSMRALQAGFICVVAEGSYVYHAEHKTVKKMPEREALFSRNQAWCQKRWGKRLRIAWPLTDLPEAGSDRLRERLSLLRDWARRNNHVYAYVPAGLECEALFRSVGLVRHADIHWIPVPAQAARLSTAVRILSRRKKPFDLITAPDRSWESLMSSLGWIHGAEVVPQSEDKLTEAWKRKSQSPS